MRRITLTITAVAIMMVAGTLLAQNWGAEPLYGSLNLNTGFTPDPQSVAVQAGGESAVSTLAISDPTGGFCAGYIAAGQPDVRLNYTAGTTWPLRIYVQSMTDTTLLVNLPDTTWRCNDDYAGLNPLIHLDTPPSGHYDIWIGTYSPGSIEPATLYVSELSSMGPTP